MSTGEFILYQTEDGLTELSLHAIDGTVWLTQSDIADLFASTPQNITLHIKSIFNEEELDEASTCKDFLQVQMEGGQKLVAERYEQFDAKRKQAEAVEADQEDIEALEMMAKSLEKNQGVK